MTDNNEIPHILDKFNMYHERIQFTIETTNNNNAISFLDLNILNENGKIIVDWFQKNTSSGRLLSFLSYHPTCHKVGTIFNLIDRAILLSHPRFHIRNITNCISILLDNGYPLNMIFHYANRRIRKLASNINYNKNNGMNKGDKSSMEKDSNNKKFIVLPFVKDVTGTVGDIIKNPDIKVGFHCFNKLNRFIKPHKDKNKFDEFSNVVYKISCRDCDASYVGQTKRQLKTRLKEHKSNVKLDSNKLSVISEHINLFNHTFNWDNVEILDVE